MQRDVAVLRGRIESHKRTRVNGGIFRGNYGHITDGVWVRGLGQKSKEETHR